MIIEGLKLMAVGMTTVLLFLSLMIVLIHLASSATRKITERELELIELEKKKRAIKAAEKKRSPQNDHLPIAVFAAAIIAYETDKAQGQYIKT